MPEKGLALSQIFNDDEISIILSSLYFYKEFIESLESFGLDSSDISVLFHNEEIYLESVLDDFILAITKDRSD